MTTTIDFGEKTVRGLDPGTCRLLSGLAIEHHRDSMGGEDYVHFNGLSVRGACLLRVGIPADALEQTIEALQNIQKEIYGDQAPATTD